MTGDITSMTERSINNCPYRLFWRRSEGLVIGEVRIYSTDRRKSDLFAPILKDDEGLAQIPMRFIAVGWNDTRPVIVVSSDFIALPRQFREAAVWHEVGHIHHDHRGKDEFKDQAQLRAARIRAIEEGRVLPSEREADEFAVARVGKEALIGFLRHLSATRPKGGSLGWNQLGRQELDLRIGLIESSM